MNPVMKYALVKDQLKKTVRAGLWAAALLAAPAALADGLAMHGTPKYGPDASHLAYANPEAPKGGIFRQAGIGSFDSLNPFAIKGRPADGLALVNDRLMARIWDEPFTLYPLVAERADVADDRSSVTFHIDPRARFHDGAPMTVEDVLFSFETLRDSGRPNMRRIYALAHDVSVDGNSITFKFGEGYDRETVMIFAMMPVLSKAYWSARTFDMSTLDIPLGSGPYKIAAVDPGRKITYERVRDYWAADHLVNRGHHNFDTIVYDYFRDDMVAFEAFKAGALDFRREMDAGRWVTGYNFPAAQRGDIKRDAIPHQRAERVRSLIFNTRRAPFDDARVREALSPLLDFDWINKNLFHGQYRQIASIFPNTDLAATNAPSAEELTLLAPYRDTLPPEVFENAWTPAPSGTAEAQRENMRRADRLLSEAGWRVVNGKRVDGNGKPLTFEIILSDPNDEKIALSYTRALKRLGIDAGVRVLDQAAFVGRLTNYDYDMVLYFWQNSLSPGTEQMLYWSCAAANTPSRWNYAGICHPAVDRFAGAIANAQSREELTSLARALDRVIMAGHYFIPLYYAGQDNAALRKNVHRPETTPLYGIVTETWWAD